MPLAMKDVERGGGLGGGYIKIFKIEKNISKKILPKYLIK